MRGDNLKYACMSTGDECKYREDDENEALDEPPLKEAEVTRLFPEGDDLDEGRTEEPEDREEDGAHKWYEGLQVRQSDGYHN